MREPGAVAVRRLLKADAGAASRLSEVEVASALVRRAREGAFTIEERDLGAGVTRRRFGHADHCRVHPRDYGRCASSCCSAIACEPVTPCNSRVASISNAK